MSADGGLVKPGLLFRSAVPFASDLVPEGITWPPTTIIDLRSSKESVIESGHPLAGAGVEIHKIPLLTELSPGEVPVDNLVDLYQLVLKSNSGRLVQVVETVADSTGATLVHCAVGKDRTGISIAMVLSLIGVPRDEIVADYLETAKNTLDIRMRLAAMYGLDEPVPESDFLRTPVEAIDGVLDLWERHAAGATGWFTEVGGTDNTIDKLRDSMVQ